MSDATASFPLATRLKAALYVLVLVAVTAFAYTDDNATALILLLVSAALAWLLVDSPERPGAGLPKFLLNFVVLAAACFLWFEVTTVNGSPSLIISLTHFIMALLACKLFERKTPRDIIQILILTLMTVVASAMFSSSAMFYTLLLAVYFGLLFYTVALLNLGVEFDRAQTGRTPAVLPHNGGLVRLRRDLRMSAKQCAFFVLPFAVLIFLLLPRTRSVSLAASFGVGSYQTGYTDTVQFHDYGQLTQSDAVVMIVRLSRGFVMGPDGTLTPNWVTSEFNDLYYRGQVLDEYDQQAGWYNRQTPMSALSTRSATEVVAGNPEEIVEHFDLQIPAGPRLFLIAPILAPRENDKTFSSRYMTLQYHGLTPPAPYPYKYRVTWQPSLQAQAIEDSLLTPQYQSPQITALARDLARELFTSAQPSDANPSIPIENIRPAVVIFENYLKTNYPYSLSFRQVDHKLDHTTDFLLNRKKTGGYCEEFASAMVMLCRAVGLNARMVTGYHGGEYSPFEGGYFIVRQKDAHAWAEIYVPGQGWVTSDPSPINTNSALGDSSVARWINDLASFIKNAWLSLVVSFDNESRAAVAAWFTQRLRILGDFATGDFWRALLGNFWSALYVLGCLLGLAGTIWWAIRRWRKDPHLVPLSAKGAAFPRAGRISGQAAFLDTLLRLFDHPNHRRADQTPLEFLLPHLSRLGTAAQDARWLVQTAYGIRFGQLPVDADLRSEIARALRHVKESLRRK